MFLWALACGGADETCPTGQELLADGSCQPVPTGDDDDDDDDDDDVTTPTAETGTTSTGCPTFYAGPTAITDASVTCLGPVVTLAAETTGWAGDARVYEIEQNTPSWSDEHPLGSVEREPCGAWETLDVNLTTGAAVATWASGTSTVFTCATHYDANQLTFAVAVWDTDLNLADCVVWGADPAGVRTGAHLGVNDPTFDTSGCRTITP
ncbi:MAG: hypothetical protein H6735_19350 [Alphaproteobacteria bacterium]|nr:hypothetical protein [Alphaproteobacteria bacterium]